MSRLPFPACTQVGADAAAFLARCAPTLLTNPPPLLNNGSFHLTAWPRGGEGEATAVAGAPPHSEPPAYGPGDPEFDPELDG